VDSYGLLVAGFNYSNVSADEFHDWLDTEHIPERVRTPGFMQIHRWLGAADPKISIVTYELESYEVLHSAKYLAISQANMSPWSRRVSGRCQRICRFEAMQTRPGRQEAPSRAGGLLLVAMNVAPEHEDDLNRWYNEEHVPALAAVDGVLAARRFRMPGGTHRYLATYHLESPEVQATSRWEKAVRTEWTVRLRPHFRDVLRLVLRPYVRGAA
jgi:hypothetical protein